MLMSHLTTKESSDLNVAMMMEQRAPTEWRSRKMLLCIAAFGLILWSSLVAVGITLYIVSANANSNELKCCPGGWSKSPYGTKCLYFSSKQLSWSDAARYCQKFDAQLLSIHSDRESEMIRRFIPNDFPDTGIWLGGGTKNPDAGVNGWYWLDPIPFDFENWVDGQPDNSASSCRLQGLSDKSQSCLQIFNIRYSEMKLDDECCSAKRPFICGKLPNRFDCIP